MNLRKNLANWLQPTHPTRLEVQPEYEGTIKLMQDELRRFKAITAVIATQVELCIVHGAITHEEALKRIEEELK